MLAATPCAGSFLLRWPFAYACLSRLPGLPSSFAVGSVLAFMPALPFGSLLSLGTAKWEELPAGLDSVQEIPGLGVGPLCCQVSRVGFFLLFSAVELLVVVARVVGPR